MRGCLARRSTIQIESTRFMSSSRLVASGASWCAQRVRSQTAWTSSRPTGTAADDGARAAVRCAPFCGDERAGQRHALGAGFGLGHRLRIERPEFELDVVRVAKHDQGPPFSSCTPECAIARSSRCFAQASSAARSGTRIAKWSRPTARSSNLSETGFECTMRPMGR